MSDPILLKPGERLLICRTDRLGDLILALPFVQSMRLRYPENPIDVAASVYASPILDRHPAINGIVRILPDMLREGGGYQKDLLKSIKATGYRVAIVLYPDRSVTRLMHEAGIPILVGTAGRFHSYLFTHRLLHSRKRNRKHESHYNLDFLSFFLDGPVESHPQVYFTAAEEHAVAELIDDRFGGKGYIVIHPGSGGSARRWPLARYLALGRELQASGHRVCFSGSPEEQDAIRKGAEQIGYQNIVCFGRTDLRQLALLLRSALRVISNSTGPLHLAAAVGTRVIGLYPAEKGVSPVRWGPLGDGHTVLMPRHAEADMLGITVEEVLQAVQTSSESVTT